MQYNCIDSIYGYPTLWCCECGAKIEITITTGDEMKKDPYETGDAYECEEGAYDVPQAPTTITPYLDAKSEEDRREIPIRNIKAGIELAKVHAFGGGNPGDKNSRDELDLALSILGNDTQFMHQFMRNFSLLEESIAVIHDLAKHEYQAVTCKPMSISRLNEERDLLNLMGLLKLMGMQIRDFEDRDPITGAQMNDVEGGDPNG